MFCLKLFNKIELTSEMKLMAEKMIDNKWFRNCGKVNDFNIPFDYQFSSGIDEVEKQLSYRNDIKGFVTLENLFIEVGFRGQIFLSLHNKKEHNSWNRVTDLIVKNYIKNKKFDFSKIESLYFDSVYNVNVNLLLKEVFITTLREIYFQEKIENYPFFFTKIIDVYLKGNIITGWGGKFSNHNQQIKEIAPISPEEGILTVW